MSEDVLPLDGGKQLALSVTRITQPLILTCKPRTADLSRLANEVRKGWFTADSIEQDRHLTIVWNLFWR